LLLLAHLLWARLALWAGIMETEVLHVRFDVVEVWRRESGAAITP
jgi:hypothetical protein